MLHAARQGWWASRLWGLPTCWHSLWNIHVNAAALQNVHENAMLNTARSGCTAICLHTDLLTCVIHQLCAAGP